jgi:hypothetical protein
MMIVQVIGKYTDQGGQLRDGLHHTPQDEANDDVRQEKSGWSRVGICRSGSNKKTRANATAKTDHGDLVVTESSLRASMTADTDLRRQNLVGLFLDASRLLDIAVDVVTLNLVAILERHDCDCQESDRRQEEQEQPQILKKGSWSKFWNNGTLRNRRVDVFSPYANFQ